MGSGSSKSPRGTEPGRRPNSAGHNVQFYEPSRGPLRHDRSPRRSSLQKKIYQVDSIQEEEARAAWAIAEHLPHFKDEFDRLVLLRILLDENRPREFVEEFSQFKEEFGFCGHPNNKFADFFALIGGAEGMVKMYADALASIGRKCVTELLLYFRETGEVGLTPRKEEGLTVIEGLRKFFLSMTDTSVLFTEHVIAAGLFRYLAEDLRNLDDSSFRVGQRVFYVSVGILYNCARNMELRHKFREISAVSLLMPMLERKEKIVKLLTLLTLSYIIDEKDNHLLLADDRDFDFLLEMISQAWRTADRRYWDSLNNSEPIYFRLEELLQGLRNLARNDVNKKVLMGKGVLDYLKPILKEGTDVEKEVATAAVWLLAFDKDNKVVMRDDQALMTLLQKLSQHKSESIARSAKGVLFVIDEDRHEKPEEGEEPRAPKYGHVMISYQWDNQKTIVLIRDMLRERGFPVWVDIVNMSGSTLQAMAEAVEGASVVLMCMSQRYKDSPNCRMEAEYASELRKPIIPLLMQAGYRADGWLGILRGAKLFFDFSGRYPFERKFEELVKELNLKGCFEKPETGSKKNQEKKKSQANGIEGTLGPHRADLSRLTLPANLDRTSSTSEVVLSAVSSAEPSPRTTSTFPQNVAWQGQTTAAQHPSAAPSRAQSTLQTAAPSTAQSTMPNYTVPASRAASSLNTTARPQSRAPSTLNGPKVVGFVEAGEKATEANNQSTAPAVEKGSWDTKSWTSEDVSKWLGTHGLEGNPTLQKLTGENIKFLQRLCREAPEYFYSYVERKLQLVELDELMNFTSALDKLP